MASRFAVTVLVSACSISILSAVSASESLRIPEIQGPGRTSPYEGVFVKATGVVTALTGTGFYMQDAKGDENDLTSDGILVRADTAEVAVGDLVEVEDIEVPLSHWSASDLAREAVQRGIIETISPRSVGAFYFNNTMAKPFKWIWAGKPLTV